MKVSKLLTKGMTDQETQEFTRLMVQNETILERIRLTIQEKSEEVRRDQIKPSYDLPAWSERQADLLGYLRALDEIFTLLKLRD